MGLETFIRLIDHLLITNSSDEFFGWVWTSSKRTKALFRDEFKDVCLHRYASIQSLIDTLCIDNIEISVEARFDADKVDFEYYLILVIDDDEYEY